MAQNCKEIRLVFDRYITCSLKSRTRKKRTSVIRYYIAGDTNIANISLKELLSHIETKQQFTVCLLERVISKFERLGIDYVVGYYSISKTNQEADTLLIMHCWEIARRITLNQCSICSADTDVFLLLTFHCPSLPNALTFLTGKGSNLRDISIGSCYKALVIIQQLCSKRIFDKSLGKSKTFWWKNFMNADDNILKGLGKF